MAVIPKKRVSIFTDGSCLGNPGPGGYGIVLNYGGHTKEVSCGFRKTTNNRMELLAAIEGLALLNEPCDVALYSDSKYLVDAMRNGWPYMWRDRGWVRDRNKPVANSDLWPRLLPLVNKHDVDFHWVKGHSGHPENERCDTLAVAAAQGNDLAVDEGYENAPSENLVSDWSSRGMSPAEVQIHDRRLKELTDGFRRGGRHQTRRFLCPILLKEEETELCRGHIVPKAAGGREWVIQRKDVDNFFGTKFEADYNHGIGIQGLDFDNMIKYMLQKRPSSRAQWLLKSRSGERHKVSLQHVDNEHFAVHGPSDVQPGQYELGMEYDLRYPTLVSCLHTLHLGQFKRLGYTYANSNAARYTSRLLSDLFNVLKARKLKGHEAQEQLERLCITHKNMVRPVMYNAEKLDQRLLQDPFEWFLVAWDGNSVFATIHFLQAGGKWNAVMQYNLEANTALLVTALVVCQRPLSFQVGWGRQFKDRVEVGKPGNRISWPCGDQTSQMTPYPIRRAVNDIKRRLEGMPAEYSIF